MARSSHMPGMRYGAFRLQRERGLCLVGNFLHQEGDSDTGSQAKRMDVHYIVFPGTARQDQPRCRGAPLDWNPAVTRAQRDWEEQAEYPDSCREPQIVTAGLMDQGGPEGKQVLSSQHEGCPWSAPVSGRQMGPEQSPSTLKGACLEDAWERGRARSPAHSCQAKASVGWLMARRVLVLPQTATTL